MRLILLMLATGALWAAPPELLLKPARADSNGRVPYVDVALSFDAGQAPAGAVLVRLPLVASNVETIARTVGRVTVGDVVLEPRDAGSEREWVTPRALAGRATVRYRAPISNAAATRGAAPPLELRSDRGAFSGAGETFLLLPSGMERARLRWDLTGLGGVGVSSAGVGEVDARLKTCFFMAGAVHTYPDQPRNGGFFAAWHGAAPFDVRALMASAEKLYAYYLGFFREQTARPYGVFLRENPVNAGGGVELGGSFVATFGPKTDVGDLRITLAHEMLHTFAGGLDGGGELASAWYSEGLAVHYARVLALRAGAISRAAFLADLNQTAARYYTDVFIGLPNREIPARFWADTRVRVLPYDRGAMYFAVLDGQLRHASAGRRGLDYLLLKMVERRRRGERVDQAAWEELLQRELGQTGVDGLHAMLNGATLLPEPGAFGPSFTRTVKRLRRYELGFEPAVLTESPRVVRGLVAGSAAERAGLRNGDEIVRPVPQDAIQARQDATLTLRVRSNGVETDITYLPRGEAVDAYQWVEIRPF